LKKLEIALIHASFRPLVNPLALRDYWFSQAQYPSRVKHYLAFEDSDNLVRSMLGIPHDAKQVGESYIVDKFTLATTTVTQDTPSAVRNWNAAAQLSKGDCLMVISDDTAPQAHWDSLLESVILQSKPDGPKLWVLDDDRCDSRSTSFLPRHPVLNREYYLRRGFIFNPKFHGRGSDDDLLMAAINDSTIYDATSLRIHHTKGEILDSTGNLSCRCKIKINSQENILSESQIRIRQGSNAEIMNLLRQQHKWRVRYAYILLADSFFHKRAVKVREDKKIVVRNLASIIYLFMLFKVKVFMIHSRKKLMKATR
jgi:hypothetical protein